MNDLQPIIEEDEDNHALIPARAPDSSLWHYQAIKGLSFFQELIVISVVTVLGCVFTLTRLDFKNLDFDTDNTEHNKTDVSSLASIGPLASIGTIENRFFPGLETPSLVRRFSSDENSLEWFANYPHPSMAVSTQESADLNQENSAEKKQSSRPADNGNLRETLKLIAGAIYANNANNPPDHYSIPEKWQAAMWGNKIVYKKYNQYSAVVYSLSSEQEDQGPDERHPFYALIWPPNSHPEGMPPRDQTAKIAPSPEKHIDPTNKKIQIKKILRRGQASYFLDTTNLPQSDEESLPKKDVEKAFTIQVIEKAPLLQDDQLLKDWEHLVQKSTLVNEKDSLIEKISALTSEDVSRLTRDEMKEAHLMWFTQGLRKLLSEEQLEVIPREQWVYLSDAQIHRMSAEMRNSLGQEISLFQPERVEKIFSISQIESFLEANIDVPEALSALIKKMNAEQIAGISNPHFSVIVHWLNPTQISFARPEQIAMLSLEAYARLDFLQRAAFTPLQRAAEANIALPNAVEKPPDNTINLVLSGSEGNQRAVKIETERHIEDRDIPDSGQKKKSALPLRMNPKLNNRVLSISEIRAMQTDRVREIVPQQIYAVTARGHIHYFSEVQIQAFTSRQINSALSSTRKNGELAYLIHRLTPAQIKMVSPMLCDRIYLDWIPENGRKGLSPQQLAALRIGDPAYLSSLTDKQLAHLSLDQIVLTGKKRGIQHLSNEQIQTMTSAQITAFISEVTNSGQLSYLVHRLSPTQIKTLSPDLTNRIFLDWIPENGRSVLTSEQLSAIRIGNPEHLSSLTEEQRQSLHSIKLAKTENNGRVQSISQSFLSEQIVELKTASLFINPD